MTEINPYTPWLPLSMKEGFEREMKELFPELFNTEKQEEE